MKNLTFTCLLPVLLLFTFSSTSYSQERTLQGVVTTFDSIPLIGAEIKVMSSKMIVLSDDRGHFEISCSTGDKVKVSAHGFNQQKIKITEKTKIALVNLNLKPGSRSRNIALGYGHVADKDKLFAISSIESDENEFSKYATIYDVIRGKFPGVEIVNNEIIIRGTNSFNYSSAALIVVDGVVEGNQILETLSPMDVKSIDILKDGSTSIYGMRGASGVVLIKTKRGEN